MTTTAQAGCAATLRHRAWGKYRYEYDEWGQVILRGEGHREKTLAWDADGHLLRVISGDRTTHYRYDALGRRTHKVTRTDMQDRVENETHFLWQGTRLLEERTGESRKTYIYGDARSPVPVACAERNGGREEIYHYQSDPSLRIRTVTDETGKVVWDGCWQAWGRMQADLSGPGGFEQSLRLAGQYYDRESGLHYNLFRYYDPDVPGRFLSSDPIGLAGGINLYRYAPNALGWIDPWGLASLFELGTYGGLNSGDNVADGLQAHELIRHEFLRESGLAGDSRLSGNPSIALDLDHHTRGPEKDTRGKGGVHYHENRVREERGLGRNEFAPTVNEEIDITSEAMRRAGIPEGKISTLRSQAIEFYNNLKASSSGGCS